MPSLTSPLGSYTSGLDEVRQVCSPASGFCIYVPYIEVLPSSVIDGVNPGFNTHFNTDGSGTIVSSLYWFGSGSTTIYCRDDEDPKCAESGGNDAYTAIITPTADLQPGTDLMAAAESITDCAQAEHTLGTFKGAPAVTTTCSHSPSGGTSLLVIGKGAFIYTFVTDSAGRQPPFAQIYFNSLTFTN